MRTIIALCLALWLAGCGEKQANTEPTPQPEQNKQTQPPGKDQGVGFN